MLLLNLHHVGTMFIFSLHTMTKIGALRRRLPVVFYCHFPDTLLALHTTVLRRIYRKPIDIVEEITTGMADFREREGVSHRVNFITSCLTAESNALLSECLCVLYTPEDEHFGIVPLEAWQPITLLSRATVGDPLSQSRIVLQGFFVTLAHEISLWLWQNSFGILIWQRECVEKLTDMSPNHFLQKKFVRRLNQYLLHIAGEKVE